MIEVYLNSNRENLRFPVVPSEFGKNINADISAEKIVKKGKVNIYNGYEPSSLSFNSFFPHEGANYSFVEGDLTDPYSYVNKLEKWCKEGERLRYIVTETSINIPVRISHFEFTEKDASGDVYYSIELKEDEDIEIPEWTPPAPKNSNTKIVKNTQTNRRSVDSKKSKVAGKVHIVKHGEYLYMIAKRYYGDGRQYKRITSNAENIKKYPSLKRSNIIYSNWKLVIP